MSTSRDARARTFGVTGAVVSVRRGDRVVEAGLVWSVVAGSEDESGDEPIAVRIEVDAPAEDDSTPEAES